MTLWIKGLITQIFDFTKDVGKGSRAQVDGFIFLTMFSTSCCEMSEKRHRGCEIPGCGSTVGTDRTGELEKTERKLSTFFLKKSDKVVTPLLCNSWMTMGLWFKDVIDSREKLLGITWTIINDIGVVLWLCFSQRPCICLLMFSVGLPVNSKSWGHKETLKYTPCCLHLSQFVDVSGLAECEKVTVLVLIWVWKSKRLLRDWL